MNDEQWTDIDACRSLTPIDASEVKAGDRVFTFGIGVVLYGTNPVYGTSVPGYWWTINQGEGTQLVAEPENGSPKVTIFEPAERKGTMLHVLRGDR